nr:hypothetical protein [Variovorax boronicumulans]
MGFLCLQLTPVPGSFWIWSGTAWLPEKAPAVVNDLTTGGTTAALSAEQGKALQLAKADVTSTVAVASSHALAATDDGKTLECTATATLTVPATLPAGFRCQVIPFDTTSVASAGGALLNGATTTLTRAATANPLVTIVARASAANSYVVTGT